MLQYYENGQHKFDDKLSCQRESHRNHKRSSKTFIHSNIEGNGSKYFRSMLRGILDYDNACACNDSHAEEIEEKDELIKDLTKKNNELKRIKYDCETLHSKENMRALAQSLVIEMNEKFKREYVCDREDIKELNGTIRRKTEAIEYYKEQNSELATELEYQRQKTNDTIMEAADQVINASVTLTQDATKSLQSEIKQLKEQLKSKDGELKKFKDNSSSISSDQKDKYVKMIKDLRVKIMDLENDHI